MNVIDEQAITDKIINPLVDRVKAEIIPQLNQTIADAIGSMGNIIASERTETLAALDKEREQLMNTIANQMLQTETALMTLINRFDGLKVTTTVTLPPTA